MLSEASRYGRVPAAARHGHPDSHARPPTSPASASCLGLPRTCVQQAPREHAAVLRGQRQHDMLRLPTLRLVHCDGIRKLQLAKFHALLGREETHDWKPAKGRGGAGRRCRND